jgi:hypothetical protein
VKLTPIECRVHQSLPIDPPMLRWFILEFFSLSRMPSLSDLDPIAVAALTIALSMTAHKLEHKCIGRMMMFSLFVVGWLTLFDHLQQLTAVLAVLSFSFIEMVAKFAMGQRPTTKCPVTMVHLFFTPWKQFWTGVLYAPVLLFTYGELVTHFHHRILLFPLNMWAMEIFSGTLIEYFFASNDWKYDDEWAQFEGKISLMYAAIWLLFGAALEYGGLERLLAVAGYLNSHVGVYWIVGPLISLTLFCYKSKLCINKCH